ncbi:MAG: hypothetical protein AB7O66_20520 [Limisphaerales bacterium]
MLKLFDRLNLTPSERRLVVGVMVVAFLVINYWVVWPRFNDFKTVSDDIASMERRKKIFEQEIARRPTYEVLLRKLKAEGSVLPVGEERIAFRSDMERLAREVGLMVPRWGEVLPERGGQNTNAFFEAIGITLQGAGGTEQQFVEFLHRVGSSNSTIRVKELTLTPGNFDSRTRGRTNLIGNMKLVASVQKPATNTPAGASASTTGTGPATGPRTNAIRSTAVPVR